MILSVLKMIMPPLLLYSICINRDGFEFFSQNCLDFDSFFFFLTLPDSHPKLFILAHGE